MVVRREDKKKIKYMKKNKLRDEQTNKNREKYKENE